MRAIHTKGLTNGLRVFFHCETANMTLFVGRTCTWRHMQVFDTGVVLADGEFSQLESAIIGAPLEMTNNYMSAMAYNEVRSQAASFFFWRTPSHGRS